MSITWVKWNDFSTEFSWIASGSQCVKVKTHLFGAQLNLYWNETFWWTQTKITLLNRLARALFSFFPHFFHAALFSLSLYSVASPCGWMNGVCVLCLYEARTLSLVCSRCSGVYSKFARLLSSQIIYLHPVKVFVLSFVFQCIPFRWWRWIMNIWRHDKSNTITYFAANLCKQSVVSGQKATKRKITYAYASCWVEVLGHSCFHSERHEECCDEIDFLFAAGTDSFTKSITITIQCPFLITKYRAMETSSSSFAVHILMVSINS